MKKSSTATRPPKNDRLLETRNDMSQRIREQVTGMLNQSLADTFDLMSQVKQAHWNVKGPHFYQLHELFDTIAGELSGFADDLAERVTALGGEARGTVRMAGSVSGIPEYPLGLFDGQEHLQALVDRFAIYCKTVRKHIDSSAELGDAGTADLYTEISRTADKRLWFLESHIYEE